jgi:photosystem II stability/assembly factor-like uncharacterized protein
MAAHPTDPNTLFVATPNGGVWRTTDGGATWSPLTDSLPLSIGAISYDPTDGSNNTLVAGFGKFSSR